MYFKTKHVKFDDLQHFEIKKSFESFGTISPKCNPKSIFIYLSTFEKQLKPLKTH